MKTFIKRLWGTRLVQGHRHVTPAACVVEGFAEDGCPLNLTDYLVVFAVQTPAGVKGSSLEDVWTTFELTYHRFQKTFRLVESSHV
mmetsp:Transcript_12566/g.23197  ORF Transcript_12566/g.23197 Transcript_12566/m.23197 type:complete len:86 (+) Transcript_12566:56-313(+)